MTVTIVGRYATTLVDKSIKYLQDAVNKFEAFVATRGKSCRVLN